MALSIDDVGQELVERHFVYRDEWATSLVHRCDSGHLSLYTSRLETDPSGEWTCTRYVDGVLCKKVMALYVPDDEGLTPLQWAKRALRRESARRTRDSGYIMALVKAVKDLVVLAEFGDKEAAKMISKEILSRPAVKKMMDWLK